MPAHRLGPDVVGQRIVVRRLVPGELGPTGGPAFTDLLGVCTSWSGPPGAEVCVVQPEAGDPVTIPVDLIVSGKPVPPRASPRLRVSVREAELLTASLVGIETSALGEWQLRYEPAPVGRVRNRFNSCLGLGDPGIPLAEAAERVRAFYVARDRPARIQTELGSTTEGGLRALGWQPVPGRDSHFLLASLARAGRILGASGTPTAAEPPTIRSEEGRVTVSIGDAARGEAGIDRDWLGVHNLSVEPAYRRQGLARAVLRELLGWGAERGATTVWLHVQTDNAPGLALYESLGFTIHHSCRYLEAPAS